jgi:hypothetical protein
MDKLLTFSMGHPSPPKVSQTSLSGLTQFIPMYFGNFEGEIGATCESGVNTDFRYVRFLTNNLTMGATVKLFTSAIDRQAQSP